MNTDRGQHQLARPTGNARELLSRLGGASGGEGSPYAKGSALMVCGTTSDAGKSFLVAGLCRLLARNGVRVAPFKAQNMANNAAVTSDGAEIGHAQWLQAVAAGVEPVSAMNPVLLKPTGERTSQVVVHGQVRGEMSADSYHRAKAGLLPVVLEALDGLRSRFDVVICEGAGSPAEINLLDRDIVNLALADAADLPAVVVGDIDRGGVFAALYGTVALLPAHLRARVKGFVVNKLRGDPGLLGSACRDLEDRCGVPTLGVIPHVPGPDLDGEDSLTLDNHLSGSSGRRDDRPALPDADEDEDAGDVLDVAAVRWPLVANAGDLDPLRMEPKVRVRWVRSPAELGRPDLVVLPGSKATRSDLDWFRSTGLAAAVEGSGAPTVAICAGLQMCGTALHDPGGVEGPPGSATGLGWLPLATTFEGDKVLDRPAGTVVDGPGQGSHVTGYRIHHGRVRRSGEAAETRCPPSRPAASGDVEPAPGTVPASAPSELADWLVAADGSPLGWRGHLGGDSRGGRYVFGSTLHAMFEDDAFRSGFLSWVAQQAGKRWTGTGTSFAGTRHARLDRIADAIEAHVDLDRLTAIIAGGTGRAPGDGPDGAKNDIEPGRERTRTGINPQIEGTRT